MKQLDTQPLSRSIFARYAQFGFSVGTEAQMLFLDAQPEELAPASYHTSIENIYNIHRTVEENQIINLTLNASFLNQMLVRAVEDYTRADTGARQMLEHRLQQAETDLKQTSRQLQQTKKEARASQLSPMQQAAAEAGQRAQDGTFSAARLLKTARTQAQQEYARAAAQLQSAAPAPMVFLEQPAPAAEGSPTPAQPQSISPEPARPAVPAQAAPQPEAKNTPPAPTAAEPAQRGTGHGSPAGKVTQNQVQEAGPAHRQVEKTTPTPAAPHGDAGRQKPDIPTASRQLPEQQTVSAANPAGTVHLTYADVPNAEGTPAQTSPRTPAQATGPQSIAPLPTQQIRQEHQAQKEPAPAQVTGRPDQTREQPALPRKAQPATLAEVEAERPAEPLPFTRTETAGPAAPALVHAENAQLPFEQQSGEVGESRKASAARPGPGETPKPAAPARQNAAQSTWAPQPAQPVSPNSAFAEHRGEKAAAAARMQAEEESAAARQLPGPSPVLASQNAPQPAAAALVHLQQADQQETSGPDQPATSARPMPRLEQQVEQTVEAILQGGKTPALARAARQLAGQSWQPAILLSPAAGKMNLQSGRVLLPRATRAFSALLAPDIHLPQGFTGSPMVLAETASPTGDAPPAQAEDLTIPTIRRTRTSTEKTSETTTANVAVNAPTPVRQNTVLAQGQPGQMSAPQLSDAQVNQLAQQVYKSIERRLRSEKMRRGLI